MRILKGNIFNASAEVIVNPVNSVGVMGGGLAAAFERRFPNECGRFNISQKLYYKTTGKSQGDVLLPTCMVPVDEASRSPYSYILMFPTKKHWAKPSELSFISTNIIHAVKLLESHLISSVAFPKLGCGLGGLDWNDVEPIMTTAFENSNIDVQVYV